MPRQDEACQFTTVTVISLICVSGFFQETCCQQWPHYAVDWDLEGKSLVVSYWNVVVEYLWFSFFSFITSISQIVGLKCSEISGRQLNP